LYKQLQACNRQLEKNCADSWDPSTGSWQPVQTAGKAVRSTGKCKAAENLYADTWKQLETCTLQAAGDVLTAAKLGSSCNSVQSEGTSTGSQYRKVRTCTYCWKPGQTWKPGQRWKPVHSAGNLYRSGIRLLLFRLLSGIVVVFIFVLFSCTEVISIIQCATVSALYWSNNHDIFLQVLLSCNGVIPDIL
jgi:hypothetical protein